jgi:hypothetical protein
MSALISVSAWLAPIATVLAALMTAANLGSRVTGWGFVVFTVASVSWAIHAASADQTSLLATQIFLTLVNLVGAWRWLGRQAKFDEGGKAAARRSTRAPVPTLFSMASLIGSTVAGKEEQPLGKCVDAMAACDTTRLTYLVLRQGGVGGLGESLHAIDPDLIHFTPDGARIDLTAAQLSELPVLPAEKWPATLP